MSKSLWIIHMNVLIYVESKIAEIELFGYVAIDSLMMYTKFINTHSPPEKRFCCKAWETLMRNLLLSDSFSIWCVSLLSKQTFQICGINWILGEISSTNQQGANIREICERQTRKTFLKFYNVCCFRYSKMNNVIHGIVRNIWKFH